MIHRYTLLLGMVVAVQGCSKRTADGIEVSGTVAWNGQPLPSGAVTFTPDVTKDNRGHQGWAVIKDGHFDTRDTDGKPAAKGACVVMVSHRRPSTDPQHPKGTNLVVRYQQQIVIPETSSELSLDVPASYEPSVSYPDGEE